MEMSAPLGRATTHELQRIRSMGHSADEPSTSTLAAAREHARRQAGQSAATARTMPPTTATDLPPGVASDQVLWDETLGAVEYGARRLQRDSVLRVADLAGDACVNLQVFVGANPIERLSPADTVKVQWQAYLGEG